MNETAMVPSSVSISQYFNEEQVSLIKRQIAKGCTDDELKLFLYQCARTGLDPFSRQIYAIQRNEWDDKARAVVPKMSIQTGIDGFRLIAERTGKYAPGPDNEHTYTDERLTKTTAHVMKLAGGTWHKVSASAHFSEYAQTKKDGSLVKMWKEKPHIMLGKCAEALALRRAFPAEMSGLYTGDEMGTAESPEVLPPIDVSSKPKALPSYAMPDTSDFASEEVIDAAKRTFPKAAVRGGAVPEYIRSEDSQPAVTASVPSDLVACWRLIEEGSRKAHTYKAEFIPMDPQPRHTGAQHRMIHSLLGKRGLPDSDKRAKLVEKFNKDSTADLSVEEASRLIEMLEDSIKKHGNKAVTEAAKQERQAKRAVQATQEITAYIAEYTEEEDVS